MGNKLDQFDSSKSGIDRNQGREIASKYGLQYFEVASVAEGGLTELFQNLFTSMKNLIPNPPKPENMLGKGVVLGKKLLTSQKYQLVRLFYTRLYAIWLLSMNKMLLSSDSRQASCMFSHCSLLINNIELNVQGVHRSQELQPTGDERPSHVLFKIS